MKILLSSNSSWYLYNFRSELIKRFLSCGHSVILIAPNDLYSEKLIQGGVTYINININNKGLNPIFEIQTIIRYILNYYKCRPDVILHFNPKPNIYGSIAASFLSIPFINNISGLGTGFLASNFLKNVILKLYKFSQRNAVKIFFQNNDDKDLFIKKRIVKSNKCDLMPGSGVNLKHFFPTFTTKKTAEEPVHINFLFIGRIIKDKGIYEFIDAAKILREKIEYSNFQVLGYIDFNNPTAVSKREFQEWISDRTIEYLGKTDDVREYISNADCVVLPSYREGTPRTLLEAAAMGKPIIAADSIGCREPIDHGVNGYLCIPKNSMDLAAKMFDFIKLTDGDKEKMGREGRRKMEEEYDEEFVIKKYIEVIGNVKTKS